MPKIKLKLVNDASGDLDSSDVDYLLTSTLSPAGKELNKLGFDTKNMEGSFNGNMLFIDITDKVFDKKLLIALTKIPYFHSIQLTSRDNYLAFKAKVNLAPY